MKMGNDITEIIMIQMAKVANKDINKTYINQWNERDEKEKKRNKETRLG